jgi:hypothetical protein
LGPAGTTALRRIPVVDARGAAHPAAFAAAALPGEVAEILAVAARRYTTPGLLLGDAVSRRWLARNASPLGPEVAAVAAEVRRPGAHLLNLSYEWACTCGVAEEPSGPALLRVLDWDLGGLGETLSVIRQRGPGGRVVAHRLARAGRRHHGAGARPLRGRDQPAAAAADQARRRGAAARLRAGRAAGRLGGVAPRRLAQPRPAARAPAAPGLRYRIRFRGRARAAARHAPRRPGRLHPGRHPAGRGRGDRA